MLFINSILTFNFLFNFIAFLIFSQPWRRKISKILLQHNTKCYQTSDLRTNRHLMSWMHLETKRWRTIKIYNQIECVQNIFLYLVPSKRGASKYSIPRVLPPSPSYVPKETNETFFCIRYLPKILENLLVIRWIMQHENLKEIYLRKTGYSGFWIDNSYINRSLEFIINIIEMHATKKENLLDVFHYLFCF